jgi:molybdopterin-containing oxidoreductase family iron-sulfur binding subunit
MKPDFEMTESNERNGRPSRCSGGCSCNRREFLGKGFLAASTIAVGFDLIALARGASAATQSLPPGHPEPPSLPHDHLPPNDPAARIGVPGRKWIMVIDLAKCDGCGGCTVACNKMHNAPDGKAWIKVFKMQDAQHTAPYWFPRPCFQCDEPPCTKVCPVDATFKRQDGVVLIDNERCIGCRYCMAACPYSVRQFNWGNEKENPDAAMHAYSPETGFPRKTGTVEKCDFCPDLAAKGILPPCVTTCHMGAIYYGDENEDAVTNAKGETERLHKLLEDRAGYRFMEELGTKPRLYYLPPKNRQYPGPKEAKDEKA